MVQGNDRNEINYWIFVSILTASYCVISYYRPDKHYSGLSDYTRWDLLFDIIGITSAAILAIVLIRQYAIKQKFQTNKVKLNVTRIMVILHMILTCDYMIQLLLIY